MVLGVLVIKTYLPSIYSSNTGHVCHGIFPHQDTSCIAHSAIHSWNMRGLPWWLGIDTVMLDLKEAFQSLSRRTLASS